MASSLSIPAWALENQRRFLSPPPPGVKSAANVDIAKVMGVLTRHSRGILPPAAYPPADYFRDLANHPDVLVTILNTAMIVAGFDPTSENGKEQHDVFQQFIQEVYKYTLYITMESSFTLDNPSPSNDTDLLGDFSNDIADSLGDDASPKFVEKLGTAMQDLARHVINQVNDDQPNDGDWVKDVIFQSVAVPPCTGKPRENPKAAISFAAVQMKHSTTSSKDDNTVVYSNFFAINVTFRLMSSAIIGHVDYLQGSEVTGADEFVGFLNSGRSG